MTLPTIARMLRMRPLLTACLLTALPLTAAADVRVPNIFGDHMVLQRDQPNRVWGKASPNEAVSVSIADQQHHATADANGDWSVELASLEAGGPHTLTISGENQIAIADVLVGEVWICSGQSNMEWSVDRSFDPDLEKLAANHPNIRMINYPNVGRQQPVFSHDKSQWKVTSAENVGGFSAVGYFFGRQLHETLDVPVGLINDAWGGSAVDAWISRDVLERGGYEQLLARWEEIEKEEAELAALESPTKEQTDRLNDRRRHLAGNHRPANIYNGVLKSHLGYGIRGAIWYQGESNAGRAKQYRRLFPLMISSWREEWGQGEFPFYWVQLADFLNEQDAPGDSEWAELREAQTMTLDKVPNGGQAVIIDVGEGRDIHPRDKVTVGRRLARLALANDYGYDIASRSPRYQSMSVADGKASLTFEDVDGELYSFDTHAPQGFAIAGEDRKFVWAEAKITGRDQIEVWSDQVAEPKAVRYGWADNPVVNVYDKAALPLTPFRTDDWPGLTDGRE